MTAGDLHWVEFPPRGGHAQMGRRPAIVVQSATASSRLPTVLLMPLTTQLDALRFPGTVLIEADAANGLKRASIALAFQMTVLDRNALGPRLGSLSSRNLQAVWGALDEVTGRTESNPP